MKIFGKSNPLISQKLLSILKGFSTGFNTMWLFVSQEREASNDAKIKEVKRWVFLN